MKAKNRIALLIAVIAAIALLVVGMTLVVSAEDGDVVTEYGTIPAAQVSADKPFAVFTKTTGASEWTLLGTYADALADNPLTSYWKIDGEVVILLLDDVDFSTRPAFTNGIRVRPSLTIDLGGHTLRSTDSAGTGLIFYQVKTPMNGTNDRNLILKNGNITLGSKQLMLFAENSAADPGVDLLKVNVTFEDVNFKRTAFKDQPIVQVGAQNNYAETVNLTYNNCTFDMTGVTNTGAVMLFMVGNSSTTKLEMNIQVNGGEILLDSMTNFKLVYDNAPGAVTFGVGEDGYTSIRVPTGVDATHTVNGGATKIEKLSSDGTYDYFGVKTGILTKYGEIPAEYESVTDYPFVIFSKAAGASSYTFHGAYLDALADSALTSYWKIDGEIVILVRDDVDFSARAPFSNGVRVRPAMTVDLDGHTLISTNNNNSGLFFLQPKSLMNGTNDRSFTFKNGTITIGSKPFGLLGELNGSDPGQELKATITFDNIVFNRTAGAAIDQPLMKVNNCPTWDQTVTINYNDCTFDMRGAATSKMILFMAGNNAASKLGLTINVNGGEILADSVLTSRLQYVLKGAPDSAVYFGKGSDGEYTTLTLPTASGVFADQGVTTSTGVAVNYRPVEVGTDTTTYKLFPAHLINYVPKTSVTLSSDLVYNVYLPATARLASFKLAGVEYTDFTGLKTREIDGVTYYHIEIANGVLAAAEDIELIVNVKVSGTEIATATRTIGIVQYAKSLIGSSADATEIALAKDMLAYVKAALVFDGGEHAEKIARIEAVIGADYAPAVGELAPKQSTDGLDGAAILVSEHPSFVFYPELDGEGNPVYRLEDYVFYIGERAVKGIITADEDGKTCILVEAAAYEITATVSYHVLNTPVYGEYNLASYIEYAKESGDAALVALGERLVKYSESALAYKNAKNA